VDTGPWRKVVAESIGSNIRSLVCASTGRQCASFAVARRSYEYGSCAFSFGANDTMPNRSFDDANAFHRGMRRLASTKVGVAVFRPIANPLDQLVTKATGAIDGLRIRPRIQLQAVFGTLVS
jgi:hypothetical protein